MRTTNPSTALAVFLLSVAAVAAGCGDDDGGAAKTVTIPQEQQQQQPQAQQPQPQEPPNVLASGEGSADGHPFRVDLVQLQRSGATVVADARVSLLSSDEDASIQVSETFSDGEFQKLANGDSESSFVFDGIALIDPVAQKKYLVARDDQGHCVCSDNLSAVFVYRSAPIELQATLAAPPPNVTKVDVTIPNVKTFTNVPISG